MYRVASASEYLVITGFNIDDIKIAKKAWILPGQFYSILDISLVNYTFEVQAMSAEKLPFILPVVFTVGPHSDDIDSLHKYAKLIHPHDNVKELVKGIIEGEIRVRAASMTMEKIFQGTKEFKEEVFEKVQSVLNQFGLWIYNANIKRLVVDSGVGEKTQTKAANQAKIDVSVAKMKGETESIISMQMQMQEYVKKEEIRMSMEVKMFENKMEAELVKANAEVAMKKAKLAKDLELVKVEADKVVAIREAELQKEVERLKELARMEKLKAKFLRKVTSHENKAEEAKLELYKKQKEREAIMYQKEREAEAKKETARTNLYVSNLVADGKLYAKEKEAEGLTVLARAQGLHIKTLLGALGGNFAHLREYLMLYEGTVAKINTDF